jgi:hypothetical protein
MTTEELLKPRYKVIADYPGCPFKVGEILQKTKYMSGKEFVRGMLHQPDDYPANFQRLEWWEDRADDDMPNFYKHNDYGWVSETIGVYGTTICFRGRNDVIEWHVKNLLPATEAEYLEYINKREPGCE